VNHHNSRKKGYSKYHANPVNPEMVSEWGDPLQHPLLRVQFQTPQRGLDSHKTPKSIFLWLKHGMITTPKISPKWFLNLSKNGFEKSQKCSLGISCLNAEISCLNAGISCLSFFLQNL
jgi:hypothetical protein